LLRPGEAQKPDMTGGEFALSRYHGTMPVLINGRSEIAGTAVDQTAFISIPAGFS
jgi:hypothetical protein